MSTVEKGSITLSGFLVGAAVGAAVGAGVALLFAPRSGKESRAWLRDKGLLMKDRVGEAVLRTKDALRQEAVAVARSIEEAAKH